MKMKYFCRLGPVKLVKVKATPEMERYRYINGGSFANIIRPGLPRAVRMKPWKKKYPGTKGE